MFIPITWAGLAKVSWPLINLAAGSRQQQSQIMYAHFCWYSENCCWGNELFHS